jgi:hypothetical protein
MADWTLIPVGGVIIMVTEATVPRNEMEHLTATGGELSKITGIPWIFLPNTKLIDAETVKEIANRLAGIEP